MEDAVAVLLLHLGVDVEARVAELGDLLGEELDAVDAVAEDDRLVDLQLGEERVEAVHLLALLDESVVLGDALERELLHQVDLVRLAHQPLLEGLHLDGEGGREEEDLPLRRHVADELLDDRHELGREELVRLVEANDVAGVELGDALLGHVEHAARRGDDDVHRLVQAQDVVLEIRSAGAHHDLEVEVLAEVLADLSGGGDWG